MVATSADLGTATELLQHNAVQALVLRTGLTVAAALPDIMAIAEEFNLPILHANANLVY